MFPSDAFLLVIRSGVIKKYYRFVGRRDAFFVQKQKNRPSTYIRFTSRPSERIPFYAVSRLSDRCRAGLELVLIRKSGAPTRHSCADGYYNRVRRNRTVRAAITRALSYYAVTLIAVVKRYPRRLPILPNPFSFIRLSYVLGLSLKQSDDRARIIHLYICPFVFSTRSCT